MGNQQISALRDEVIQTRNEITTMRVGGDTREALQKHADAKKRPRIRQALVDPRCTDRPPWQCVYDALTEDERCLTDAVVHEEMLTTASVRERQAQALERLQPENVGSCGAVYDALKSELLRRDAVLPQDAVTLHSGPFQAPAAWNDTLLGIDVLEVNVEPDAAPEAFRAFHAALQRVPYVGTLALCYHEDLRPLVSDLSFPRGVVRRALRVRVDKAVYRSEPRTAPGAGPVWLSMLVGQLRRWRRPQDALPPPPPLTELVLDGVTPAVCARALLRVCEGPTTFARRVVLRFRAEVDGVVDQTVNQTLQTALWGLLSDPNVAELTLAAPDAAWLSDRLPVPAAAEAPDASLRKAHLVYDLARVDGDALTAEQRDRLVSACRHAERVTVVASPRVSAALDALLSALAVGARQHHRLIIGTAFVDDALLGRLVRHLQDNRQDEVRVRWDVPRPLDRDLPLRLALRLTVEGPESPEWQTFAAAMTQTLGSAFRAELASLHLRVSDDEQQQAELALQVLVPLVAYVRAVPEVVVHVAARGHASSFVPELTAQLRTLLSRPDVRVVRITGVSVDDLAHTVLVRDWAWRRHGGDATPPHGHVVATRPRTGEA